MIKKALYITLILTYSLHSMDIKEEKEALAPNDKVLYDSIPREGSFSSQEEHNKSETHFVLREEIIRNCCYNKIELKACGGVWMAIGLGAKFALWSLGSCIQGKAADCNSCWFPTNCNSCGEGFYDCGIWMHTGQVIGGAAAVGCTFFPCLKENLCRDEELVNKCRRYACLRKCCMVAVKPESTLVAKSFSSDDE